MAVNPTTCPLAYFLYQAAQDPAHKRAPERLDYLLATYGKALTYEQVAAIRGRDMRAVTHFLVQEALAGDAAMAAAANGLTFTLDEV